MECGEGGFEMTTTEKYFIALGAKKVDKSKVKFPSHLKMEDRHYNAYILPDGTEICVDCSGWPNITQSYPDFKKWVLEKMPNGGEFSILAGDWFWWLDNNSDPQAHKREFIKDNEILEAAVIAATSYLLNN